jgi:hypothetical protein
MAITPLRITAQSDDDLRVLSQQPSEQIESAYARAAAVQDNIISPKALREAMEAVLSPHVVRPLIRQLIALRAYADHAEVSPSEAVGALSLGLKQKNWPDDLSQKWEKLTKLFEQFLSLENIMTIAKALELSWDFEHILTNTKILTDVRLVYSASRDKVIGGIVCNRLRLKYHDEDADKSISISLDKDEIESLKRLCDEALKKIEMASNMLKEAKLPSFTTGEGYDDIS